MSVASTRSWGTLFHVRRFIVRLSPGRRQRGCRRTPLLQRPGHGKVTPFLVEECFFASASAPEYRRVSVDEDVGDLRVIACIGEAASSRRNHYSTCLARGVEVSISSPSCPSRSLWLCRLKHAWPKTAAVTCLKLVSAEGLIVEGTFPGGSESTVLFSVDLDVFASVFLVWLWGASAVRAGPAGLQ